MSRYASTTVSTMFATERNIGVRVSPAARIADVPMSHTVAAPLAIPSMVRNGLPTASTSPSAPRRRKQRFGEEEEEDAEREPGDRAEQQRLTRRIRRFNGPALAHA